MCNETRLYFIDQKTILIGENSIWRKDFPAAVNTGVNNALFEAGKEWNTSKYSVNGHGMGSYFELDEFLSNYDSSAATLLTIMLGTKHENL